MITWGEFVAFIGAAAWTPHVIRLLQKPKITPFPGGQIEIGFTHLGPVYYTHVGAVFLPCRATYR